MSLSEFGLDVLFVRFGDVAFALRGPGASNAFVAGARYRVNYVEGSSPWLASAEKIA